ncbi:MAG: serine hydrolase domain-containing protein [Chloroflexota bacterium]
MTDAERLAARIDELVRRRAFAGLALIVIGSDGMRLAQSYGSADLGRGAPITEDTVFRIASITKTFTAIAVMQLVEQGLVELDAPANDYLRSLRLEPARAGDRPATVRHLLTHTAGLGEIAHLTGLVRPDFGESFPAGGPLPTVAEFYGGRIRLTSEPGRVFTYGNHSPTVLGQLVEDVSGVPLHTSFGERIFEPLGMRDSEVLRSDRVRRQLATGYEPGGGGWQRVEERDMVTAAAASVFSTPADMARYLAALLGGGANAHGRVLRPETLAQMFRPHYQPDPRLPGMGLGFFRADLGGHAVVEHQGVHPGFHSHLCLAPDDGVGVAAFTNGARDPVFWLAAEAHALLGAAIGIPAPSGSAARPLDVGRTDELVGWYRLAGSWTDLRKRLFMGAGAEVFVRDGRPALRFLTPIPDLYRGYRLGPDDADDPDVLRVDLEEAGTSRVAFRRDARGVVESMTLEMMPITLSKQPARTNPRLWARSLLALAVSTVVTIAWWVLRRR